LLEKGDLPQAIKALEDSTEQLRQTGMQHLLGWFSAFLAEACLLSGQPAEARDLALQALAVTEGVRFRYGSGMAQRALGRIARVAGDPEEAATRLREALESFRSIQAPFEVGRTRLELALLAGPGSEEAAIQLGEARRIFAELRLPGYIERTERLAGELSGVPSLEPSSGPNTR
jgi:tetratricopeptide (TPR) repeat protein